ncbi:Hint domain-containing protein [Sorangium sp. So ce134]
MHAWIIAPTAAVLLSSGGALADLGFPNCPESHCSLRADDINRACIAAKMEGKPFPVVGPMEGSICTCICSCVSEDTLIRIAEDREIRVASIREGLDVYTPQATNTMSRVDHMLMSEIEDTVALKLTFDNGTEITVSPNHTFVTEQEKLTSADRLAAGAHLLAGNGSTLTIVHIEQIQHFRGRLYNLITNRKSTKAYDHVIVTNDVQSGDWIAQVTHDALETEIDLRLGLVHAH